MRIAEEPLTKVTIRLFTRDVEELRRGGDYQTSIRHIVREYLHQKRVRKAAQIGHGESE